MAYQAKMFSVDRTVRRIDVETGHRPLAQMQGNRTPRPYRPWSRCPSTMVACDRTPSHLAFCFFRFASRR